MQLSPQSEVKNLRGVGEVAAKKLKKLGVVTAQDLITYYPRRYDDFSQVVPIAMVKPGRVTVKGYIKQVATRRTHRRGFTITEAAINDGTGGLKAVWFNQPYLARSIPRDEEVYLSGELVFKFGSYALQTPAIEPVSAFPKNTARIVPIYGETEGLSSKQIRKLVAEVLPQTSAIAELLPPSVSEQQKLIPKAQALRQIHFPDSAQTLEQAQYRLAFEELFVLVLTGLVIKAEIKTETSPVIAFNERLAKRFVASLDFKLTNAQRRAAWQILQDMTTKLPMNRLLEGDVGSGKTVVAVMAALMAVEAGYQVAVLAPTETLAVQHYQNIAKLVKKFNLRIELLIGSQSITAKKKLYQAIKTGQVNLVIGTHAIIQEAVEFKNLGLAIVDEQHRFGVSQRNALKAKAAKLPHLLTMSATPIPRSLALAVYGDLDISVIDELPAGRKPITTELVKEGDRQRIYMHIEGEIKAGRQVYVICPLISESDKLGVKSVEAETERLRNGPFKSRKILSLNGRMSSQDKAQAMGEFKASRADILVSTTVVEVGVDVPNATIMLIEGAERFGLAQLHQLRGRVGRSQHQSHCYLIATQDKQARQRLELLTRYNDGFTLAQKDLEMRGPGQIYGQLQHGLLDLRLANLSDTKLIATVRQAAEDFLANEDISQHPDLLGAVNKLKSFTRLD